MAVVEVLRERLQQDGRRRLLAEEPRAFGAEAVSHSRRCGRFRACRVRKFSHIKHRASRGGPLCLRLSFFALRITTLKRSLPNARSDDEETFDRSLRCPITQNVMRNPVICADGHSYDRHAIEEWLQRHQAHPTSPLTNEVLPHTNVSLVASHRIMRGLPGVCAMPKHPRHKAACPPCV